MCIGTCLVLPQTASGIGTPTEAAQAHAPHTTYTLFWLALLRALLLFLAPLLAELALEAPLLLEEACPLEESWRR